MEKFLIFSGVVLWSMAGGLVFLVFVTLAIGTLRAISLHRFLFRVRRAVDGGWCPFRRWSVWPREFAKDAWSMVGFPGVAHGVSYHFSARDKPIEAHWMGIGEWSVQRASSTEG